MKLITAIIQPDKLDEGRESLIKAEITRNTVTRCTGHGQHQREDQGEDMFRGQLVVPDLLPKIRIDIACNEEFLDTAVNAIIAAAKHGPEGHIGDGKIFITALEQCIRIRTNERGGSAI